MPTPPSTSWPDLLVGLGPLLLLIPLIYCLFDIARHPDTRQLSAQAWMLVCVFGSLFGVAAYLTFGRSENR